MVETIVPKDPPPQFEYISDPPTISAIDLLVPESLVLFYLFNLDSHYLIKITIEEN